ncbi:MAG: hypothetical protein R3F11_16145 [Verrucomicrobiales bacterium]
MARSLSRSRDTATGEDLRTAIDSAAVDVDDANVEQMISDSVDHALTTSTNASDQAKSKSKKCRSAVESALAAIGEELPAADRAPIGPPPGEARSAATAEAQRLKSACQALDEATEHLVSLIVERAGRWRRFREEFREGGLAMLGQERLDTPVLRC